jgi:hypothetical protein
VNVVFALDGVLRNDVGEVVLDGIPVYRAFKAVGRVILITELERKAAEAWCAINHVFDYDDLLGPEVTVDPDEPLKHRQIAAARQRGQVHMYIDGDPAMVAEALRLGIPSLLLSSPSYARPEFRPDAPKGVRRWDDLMAERTRQQAMKAVDYRTQQPELAAFE